MLPLTRYILQFCVPINPVSLKCDAEKGMRVRPEHIHHELRALAGIADHPSSKRFPLGIREADRIKGLWG